MPNQANDDHLTEKCAVFAVYGAGLEAARLAFYGLWSLQHRGQESSGITTSDGDRLIQPSMDANHSIKARQSHGVKNASPPYHI